MWFKNLRLYDVDYSELKQLFKDEQDLDDKLSAVKFKPCLTQELTSCGFVPLFDGSQAYSFCQQGNYFMRLREENKLLPASVIKVELEAQLKEREAQLNRPIKKNEAEALKAAVVNQLLEKAFVTQRDTIIWANPEHNIVGVSLSSIKRCEKALAMLRQAFGTFPATALQPRCVVEDRLTSFIDNKSNNLPVDFELGSDITLHDNDDKDGAVARFSHEDLTSEEIEVHIAANKVVSQIQLTYAQSISLTLCSDLSLKRLKPLDLYLEQNLPNTEDNLSNLQAYLILQGKLYTQLATVLKEIFDCD